MTPIAKVFQRITIKDYHLKRVGEARHSWDVDDILAQILSYHIDKLLYLPQLRLVEDKPGVALTKDTHISPSRAKYCENVRWEYFGKI